jgi:hypothetical protein
MKIDKSPEELYGERTIHSKTDSGSAQSTSDTPLSPALPLLATGLP